MNKRARSVTRPAKYFAVAASPFNVVKLALGVVLVVGVLLILVTGRLTVSPAMQILLLGTYGGIAAVWLIAKTRQIARTQVHPPSTSDEKSPINNRFEK